MAIPIASSAPARRTLMPQQCCQEAAYAIGLAPAPETKYITGLVDLGIKPAPRPPRTQPPDGRATWSQRAQDLPISGKSGRLVRQIRARASSARLIVGVTCLQRGAITECCWLVVVSIC
jgi:hypothetical protein